MFQKITFNLITILFIFYFGLSSKSVAQTSNAINFNTSFSPQLLQFDSLNQIIKLFSPNTFDSIFQVDINKRPKLFIDAKFPSLSYIQFDGFNDALQGKGFSVTSPYNHILLAKIESQFGDIFDGGSFATSILRMNSLPNLQFFTGQWFYTPIPKINSHFFILNIEHKNDTSYFYVNGQFIAKGKTGSNSPNGITLGSIGHMTGNFSKMKFLEFTSYDTILSQNQRQQIHNNLFNNYHRYIDIPDTILLNSFCSQTFYLPELFKNITWSNNDTNKFTSYFVDGKYWVTYTNIFGEQFVDSFNLKFPRLNLSANSSICNSSQLTWNTNPKNSLFQFLWQDGSTDSVLTITQPGDYWVQVTDSFGCSITSDTVHIEVDSFAVQASLGPDKSLCQGNQLELATGRNEAINYLWSNGDSTTAITINTAGQYSVTATNSLGCIAEDTINISIKGLAPNPLFSFQNKCNRDSVYFIDQSTSSSGNITSWNWDFGDGNVDSNQHPSYLFSDSGKYEVMLTVVTDSGCEASVRDTVLIFPNPQADFNTGLSCTNLTTQFNDNSISAWDSVIYWQYHFGNGNLATNQNPINIYGSSQNYIPKLVVENSFGCKDSISKSLFVKPSPIADFNYSSPCINDSVLIQQSASGIGNYNYQWTLWNGFNFTGNSFANVFTATGNYPINLLVADTNNCFDTITKNIPIRNHPQILNQLNDTIICLFDTLTWNVPYPKNHFSFLWQDGSSDSLFHIDSAGTYFYQVTDSVGCSSTSQSIQVSVNNFLSMVTLGNDTSLCKGELVSLKNNPVYLAQILWNTGDTTTTIAIDSTSNYSVTLTDTMGCVGVDTFNVLLRGEAALAKMAFDTTCILDSTQFYDISILATGDTIINWEWEFGNNLLDSIQNPKTYYPASGFYPIHLKTLTNDFCFSEAFDTIQVYNLPSPSFSSPLACDNREVIFTDNSTAGDGIISNWNWSFGDANNTKSNLQNPVFTYDTSGSFSVSLEVINSFGCSNLTAQNKKVEFTPRAKFESDNVCEGQLAQFTSTSFIGVSSFYVWDFGDSIQSQGAKVQHLYDSINSYQVQLIVNSQNGCSDTAFSILEVFQNPEAKTFTGKFCKNETFAIEDNSSTLPYPISKYTWKLNNVEIDTGKFLNFSLNDTGSYDFELIITNSVGCSDSTVGAIKIDDFPIANLDYAPTFGAAPILVDFFNQSSQFFSNVWKVNDSTFSVNQEAEFNFEQNGNYNIKLINTNATGCADSITKTIKILPPILDISISNLSYEVVENSFLKSSFEVSNLGTRTINYFEILAETQSGHKLKEIFDLTIQPGETVPLSLNSQLQLPENNQFGYLCLEASNPENEGIDDNPLNNKVCLSQESFVVQNIFPNPSSNNVNIGFIVGEIDQVTVEIFKSNGKEIKLLYSGNTVIGLNTIILNVENLDAGLYVARYTFKGEKKTQNFVVTK